MMKIEIEGWVVNVDVEKTKKTYGLIKESGCLACGCNYCLNYLKNLPDVMPDQIRAFFESAGVDINKDAEVYQEGEIDNSTNYYGGEYYLWGTIISKPESDVSTLGKLSFKFIAPTALAQEEFKKDGALCFSFHTELKWLLN